MPVLPGITDAPHLLDSLVRAVADVERLVPRRVRASPAVGGATALSAIHRSRVSAARGAISLDLRAELPGRRALSPGTPRPLPCAVREARGPVRSLLQDGGRRRRRAERATRRARRARRAAPAGAVARTRARRRSLSHARRRAFPDSRRATRRHSTHRAPDRAFGARAQCRALRRSADRERAQVHVRRRLAAGRRRHLLRHRGAMARSSRREAGVAGARCSVATSGSTAPTSRSTRPESPLASGPSSSIRRGRVEGWVARCSTPAFGTRSRRDSVGWS